VRAVAEQRAQPSRAGLGAIASSADAGNRPLHFPQVPREALIAYAHLAQHHLADIILELIEELGGLDGVCPVQ
jgi:hypothetical protein